MKRCESSGRVRGLSRLTSLVLIALLALTAAPSRCEEPSGSSSTSPSDACHEIQASLKNLARAERDQALALNLYFYGAELAKANASEDRLRTAWPTAPSPRAAMVEARLHRLRQKISELREILRRVHASAVARDPQVVECLRLGYDAVFKADDVSAEIERVLISARTQPA